MVAEIVCEELSRVRGEPTTPEQRLREDLGLSSLALIQVVTKLCRMLDVSVYALSDRDFARTKTVGDLASLLAERANPVRP